MYSQKQHASFEGFFTHAFNAIRVLGCRSKRYAIRGNRIDLARHFLVLSRETNLRQDKVTVSKQANKGNSENSDPS